MRAIAARCLAGSLCALSMAVNLAAQISHFSDLRAIAVTVQDAAGQPVTDLSLKNFAVTEDGKPQRVVVCAYQDFTQFPPGPPTAPAAVTLMTSDGSPAEASAVADYNGSDWNRVRTVTSCSE